MRIIDDNNGHLATDTKFYLENWKTWKTRPFRAEMYFISGTDFISNTFYVMSEIA